MYLTGAGAYTAGPDPASSLKSGPGVRDRPFRPPGFARRRPALLHQRFPLLIANEDWGALALAAHRDCREAGNKERSAANDHRGSEAGEVLGSHPKTNGPTKLPRLSKPVAAVAPKQPWCHDYAAVL